MSVRHSLIVATLCLLASPLAAQCPAGKVTTTVTVVAGADTVAGAVGCLTKATRDTVVRTDTLRIITPPDTVTVVRRDTVVVTRVDTLTVTRTDTLRVVDTLVQVRTDTVVQPIDAVIVTDATGKHWRLERQGDAYVLVEVTGDPAPPPPPPVDSTRPPVDTTPPPPPPPVDTVPPVVDTLPPHPRVWMDPARVSFVRQQAAANTSRWARVKGWADAQLARGTAYASSDNSYLTTICAVYLGTGDARYAQRADVILRNYAVPSNDLKGDSGYDIRSGLPMATIGLDWCYNDLTPATRRQVASWLMDRADWVWPETNPDKSGRYALDRPTDNYWWGYMMTGPAGLAAYGNDTVTARNRPAEAIAIALAKWVNDATPALTEQAGGFWEEGTGYDNSGRVGSFVDAFRTAGVTLDHPFLRESLLWRIHSTMPGGDLKVPLGDQARVSDAPLFMYDRPMALDVLPTVDDPPLAARVYSWLDWIGQVPQSSGALAGVAVTELVKFDPTAPRLPIADLPLDYFAAGTGVSLYRRSWTDSAATAFVFAAGRATESHSDRADLQLLIWHGGGWATVSGNLYSHSGIRHETVWHNTLTVSGKQQLNRGGIARTTDRATSPSLVWVRGAADSAYVQYDRSNPIRQFRRTVAYLPDRDAFVVVDRVESTLDTASKVMRWHVKARPVVTGSRFTMDRGCVADVSGGTVGLEAVQLGSTVGTDTTSWAATITNTSAGPQAIVTVIQCGAPVGPVVTIGPSDVAVAFDRTRVTLPFIGPVVRQEF